MNRRAFVSGVAALVGGAFAGCTGTGEVPETAPSPPAAVREATPRDQGDGADGQVVDPEVTTVVPEENPEAANAVVLLSQDVAATDDGSLVVIVGVRNDGTARATALVRALVRTDSDEFDLQRFVDLAPGESTRVRFTPDASRNEFDGMEVEILPETPATPLPTRTPTTVRTATQTPPATQTETATDETDTVDD